MGNKAEMEAIVLKNVVSGANSLSQDEWQQMEGAMPPDEKTTHQNLAQWMIERANSLNIVEEEEDADEMAKLLGEEALEGEGADDDSDDDGEEEKKPKDDKGESEKAAADKGKNWSAVNVVYKESKLNFRGTFAPVALTNFLWARCVRPKLEETGAKGFDDIEGDAFGIADVEEIAGEFMPAMPKPKEKKDKKDEKDDKKDKKDDKKDKKKKKKKKKGKKKKKKKKKK